MNSVKISKNGLYGKTKPPNNVGVGNSYTSCSSLTNYKFDLFIILSKVSNIKVLDKDKDISRMHLSMLKCLIDKENKIIQKHFRKNFILYFLLGINRKLNKLNNEINIHKHRIMNDIKRFNNVEIEYKHTLEYFNNIKVRLKKGVLHSLEEPSVEISTDLSQYSIHLYYLNGKEYTMNDWLNNPNRLGELRKKKIDRILN